MSNAKQCEGEAMKFEVRFIVEQEPPSPQTAPVGDIIRGNILTALQHYSLYPEAADTLTVVEVPEEEL